MFRLLTLNLNHFGSKHGPWADRRKLIAGMLTKAGADIVALQAVGADPSTNGGEDQAHQLAALLPEFRNVAFLPLGKDATGASTGLALLSRHPLSRTELHRLPLVTGQSEDMAPRGVLHTRIDLPGGGVDVFNCHMSWVGAQLARNIDDAAPFLRSFAGPRLLAGDMNATPDNAALETFRREGWKDLWSHLHPDEPGFTFESDAPTMRIDYVWADDSLARRAREITVVSGLPGGPIRLSDHAGLLASFD